MEVWKYRIADWNRKTIAIWKRVSTHVGKKLDITKNSENLCNIDPVL
jgi:hypothetical protein